MPNLANDIANHKKFHMNVVNGIQVRITKKDNIVFSWEEYQLILIDLNATYSQISRLNKLSKFINASIHRNEYFSYHIHLDYPIKPEKKFFLLCFKNRIIGYLDIELVSKGLDKPTWIIKMIWLAVNYRSRGLAKNIVESSIKHLNQDLSSVGWEAPFSKQGLAFVKSLCPDGFRAFKTRYSMSVG